MNKKELISVYYGGTDEVFNPRPFKVGNGKVLRCYLEDAKPVEVEQVQADWYDYDKQQAIALPPVGVECEVYREQKWERCFVLHHANNDFVDVAACKIPQHKGSQVGFLVWADKFRPLDWNRRADEEKRAFIEAVLPCIHSGDIIKISTGKFIAERLYDAGCRFTENKAAS